MPTLSHRAYEAQLTLACDRLAHGRTDELSAEIRAGSTSGIDRYLQVGWGERHMLLTQELALVALAFDDLPALVDRYLCTVTKLAQVPHSTDHQRFLQWLKRTFELSPQQRDFIAYQQAEYSCLSRATARRMAHLAFQKLPRRSRPTASAAEAAVWHLNPVRAWSRLAMPGDDGQELRPCDVVFFPVDETVQSVRVSPRQRRWLRELPTTWAGAFDAWMAKTGCRQQEELRTSLETWEAIGLVAVEAVAPRDGEKSTTVPETIRVDLRCDS